MGWNPCVHRCSDLFLPASPVSLEICSPSSPNMVVCSVIDLGCAPGGWSQVVMQAIHPPSASSSLSGTSDNHVRAANNTPRSLFPPASGEGRVIGIDLRPMAPVPGVSFVLGDFSNAETQAALRQALGRDVGGDGMQLEEGMWKDGGGECEGTADVILSDMAPDLSGDKFRDHRRTLDLAYQVLAFADTVFALQKVRKNSALTKKQRRKTVLCKLFKGRDEEELLRHARSRYEDVRILKPKASRGESGEQYMLARGFKGGI
ncbi:ribosomal RNA large subunit methyltransferase [Nannochloropsis gaditana]|uniref:rRNA methyltransferase 2, mitochondrial n=1 Tax=Nannochloropsis gaditana TaxID=72520 RepID=W7U2A2_9STRA|nr:ribosomal RNA large subunit methyltransferase [Nannochloropsis gaditana]